MESKDILPGENLRLSIKKAMRDADFVIACLSPDSVNERGFLQNQFTYALSTLKDKLETDIYLIPVRFAECQVPDYFEDLQIADLFKKEGWEQLLTAIKIGLERRRGVPGVTAHESSQREQHITIVRQAPKIELSPSWEEKEDDDVVIRLPLRKSSAKLSLVLESEHFVVHFALVNPLTGKGLAADGVRDRSIVATYLEALEHCYEVMTSAPWSRQPPVVGPQGKTNVFVLDSAPFTSTDLQMVPYICLPSRHNEPTSKGEFELAAAEAVHEAVHLFNYSERPFHDVYSGAWAWFDCALAAYIETIVLPENLDYLRFVGDWIRMPHNSLDGSGGQDQGLFIKCLAKRLGQQFVNDIWTKALPHETPIDALVRMFPRSGVFASCEPHVRDVFGSGYCMDSYFFEDSSSDCYEPRAYERYGNRTVSDSVIVDLGETIIRDSIDHLACRYYRLRMPAEVEEGQVRILLKAGVTIAPLKAEAAIVRPNGQRMFRESLLMTRFKDSEGLEQLSCNISLISNMVDHVLLVVSNCGLRSVQKASEHDDNKNFEIVVSMI
jgi:hypothetical protein